jgi:hydroxymethylpyrimidine pyrophosphatase-like HAD family hydrolase
MGGYPDEFAAVGDNLNDLEMVGMLRHGIAVRNAHSRLKEAAVWVTDRTNDEDAIMEVFDYVESENKANKVFNMNHYKHQNRIFSKQNN